MIHKFDAQGAKCGIYAICIENKIVYIGQSSNLPVRAKEHEDCIRKGHNYKSQAWYPIALEFYRRGYDFTFQVLEEVNSSQLLERETALIRKEWPIFNERITEKERKQRVRSYQEALEILGLREQPYADMKEIDYQERLETSGPYRDMIERKEKNWFGEEYIIPRCKHKIPKNN